MREECSVDTDHPWDRITSLSRGLHRAPADVAYKTDDLADAQLGRILDELETRGLAAQSPLFRRWAPLHSAELVNTMAAAAGPHLVALMADGFGCGRIGGHGGAQERCSIFR